EEGAVWGEAGHRNAFHRIEAGCVGTTDRPGDAAEPGDILVSAAVPLPGLGADDERERLSRSGQRLDWRPGKFGNHRSGGGVRVPEWSGEPDPGHVDVPSVQPPSRRCRSVAF